MPYVITDPIACMIIAGKPMAYICQITVFSGLNLPNLNFISLFFLILNIIAITAATICPKTVAIAAPITPIPGIPNHPNIRIGSNTMLITAPIVCVIIV